MLQACSAVKVAYNQAPDLAYWYLDGYADFTGVQSVQVKQDFAALQAWHRQTQLPGYIALLQSLQQQMAADVDAAQVCTVVADVREKLLVAATQAVPIAASLTISLQSNQLSRMERKFAEGNADFRDDYLKTPARAGKGKRYEQSVKRAEMLYGSLDPAQREWLAQRLAVSKFNPALAYAERLRRQQDILQTLGTLSSQQAPPAAARTALRSLLDRTVRSPDPAYRRYAEQLTQETCSTLAALHQRTTPAQRLKARETLNAYERDLTLLTLQIQAAAS